MKDQLKAKYLSLTRKLGLEDEVFEDKLNLFLNSNVIALDEGFLKLNDFLKFCELLQIQPGKLSDDYYNFVQSNYGMKIYNCRISLGLNQKQFAKLINISPVNIYKFESQVKYPNRTQYEKLKEVL
ncbi:MAG: helix-turn-helix transcriptional regulator [Clostridium sp.]|nr:helix-turn-helix transcriptional regulator [Clostridium sp.]MDU7085742.1 helix-turn-helix transcriptional regulator [Clostridium sp.]